MLVDPLTKLKSMETDVVTSGSTARSV